MNYTSRHTYVCKRMRLLTYLKSKGYEPFLTVPDRWNPEYNVWLFDLTQRGFLDAIDEYFEKLKDPDFKARIQLEDRLMELEFERRARA